MQNATGGLKYFVLDRNYLRDRESIDNIAKMAIDSGWRLLLVDRAFFETVANANPTITTKRNLEFLVPHRELVDVGRGYGELIREEINTRKPTTDFIDYEVTTELNVLLHAIDINDTTKMTNAFNRIHSIGTKAKIDRDAQRGKDKKQLIKMINALKDELEDIDRKAIKTSPETTIPHLLGQMRTIKACVMSLKNSLELSDKEATAFVLNESVCARHFDVYFILAIDWLQRDGAMNVKEKIIENDFLDLDYVIAASYLGILLSKDEKPNRILRYLNNGLNERLTTIEDVVNDAVNKGLI